MDVLYSILFVSNDVHYNIIVLQLKVCIISMKKTLKRNKTKKVGQRDKCKKIGIVWSDERRRAYSERVKQM